MSEKDIRLVDLGQAINPRGLASCGSQFIVQLVVLRSWHWRLWKRHVDDTFCILKKGVN